MTTKPKEINLGEKADLLDRSKLHSIADMPTTSDAGSIRAIVVLVVVIVLVAVGGAYIISVIKTNQDSTLEGTKETMAEATPTPTPVEDPFAGEMEEQNAKTEALRAQVLATSPKEDKDAKNPPKTASFDTKDINYDNKSLQDAYSLKSVAAQPYETFYRVTYTFAPADTTTKILAPSYSAKYDATNDSLQLIFKNVKSDESGFEPAMNIETGDVMVSGIERTDASDTVQQVYDLSVAPKSKYFVQTVENTVLVDVFNDTIKAEETPTPTETEDEDKDAEESPTPTPSVSPSVTPKPTATTSVGTTPAKTIKTNVGADDPGAAIRSWRFFDSKEKFTAELYLADDMIPGVSATKDADGDVVLEISNLRFDGLTKDGKGFRNLVQAGVSSGVDSLTVIYGGGKSNYTFDVRGEKDVNVYINDDDYAENRLIVEIVH